MARDKAHLAPGQTRHRSNFRWNHGPARAAASPDLNALWGALHPDFSSPRTWLIGLGLLAWMISISGIFGNSGLIQAYQLAQVRHDMSLRVHALENERQHLSTTLHGLVSEPYVQEQAIRESLGFVRSNELVFEFR